MIKKCIVLLTMIAVCQAAFGQRSVDRLFSEFSKSRDATSVNIGKITMSFASLFTETMGVDGIEIFSFDDCAQEVKDRLAAAASNLKDAAYETMISSNEDGGRTRVLVRINDDMIREMVIVVTGGSHALIRIKGKIKPEDIQRLADKHGKK